MEFKSYFSCERNKEKPNSSISFQQSWPTYSWAVSPRNYFPSVSPCWRKHAPTHGWEAQNLWQEVNCKGLPLDLAVKLWLSLLSFMSRCPVPLLPAQNSSKQGLLSCLWNIRPCICAGLCNRNPSAFLWGAPISFFMFHKLLTSPCLSLSSF